MTEPTGRAAPSPPASPLAATMRPSPLAATMRRVAVSNPFVHVRLGRPEAADWLPASDLVLPDAPHLNHLLAAVKGAWSTNRRDVPASFFVHGYSWLLAAVGVGAYLVDRRVPMLDTASTLFRFDTTGKAAGMALLRDQCLVLPNDPAADDPAATVVVDADQLRGALRAMIETHLAPLIAAVRSRSSLGTRAMWLLAADNIAWTVVHHAEAAREQVSCGAEVAAFTQAVGSPLRGRTAVVEVRRGDQRGRFVARGSCCLAYKLEGGAHCDACPLLPAEERRVRLEASLVPSP